MCDDVFATRNFIKRHGHLPESPTPCPSKMVNYSSKVSSSNSKKRHKRHHVGSDRDWDAGSCIPITDSKEDKESRREGDSASTRIPCLALPGLRSHQGMVNTSGGAASPSSMAEMEPPSTEVGKFPRLRVNPKNVEEIPSASNLPNQQCERQETHGRESPLVEDMGRLRKWKPDDSVVIVNFDEDLFVSRSAYSMVADEETSSTTDTSFSTNSPWIIPPQFDPLAIAPNPLTHMVVSQTEATLIEKIRSIPNESMCLIHAFILDVCDKRTTSSEETDDQREQEELHRLPDFPDESDIDTDMDFEVLEKTLFQVAGCGCGCCHNCSAVEK